MSGKRFDGDYDMKIVGEEPPVVLEESEDSEAEKTISELKREKRYGNTSHAKIAGKSAAVAASTLCCTKDLPEDTGDESQLKRVKAQCCCAVAFGIMTGFERYISSDLVARILLNAFHDGVKEIDSGFYENFNDISMSFYYLAARHKNDMSIEIGKTFATLCKRDDDEKYIALGTALFTDGIEIARKSLVANNLIK